MYMLLKCHELLISCFIIDLFTSVHILLIIPCIIPLFITHVYDFELHSIVRWNQADFFLLDRFVLLRAAYKITQASDTLLTKYKMHLYRGERERLRDCHSLQHNMHYYTTKEYFGWPIWVEQIKPILVINFTNVHRF